MKNAVTVELLIKELSKLDPKTYIAISCDSEGNQFSLMHKNGGIMTDIYMLNEYGGQDDYVINYDKTKEICKSVFKNEYLTKDLVKVVVLFGTN